MRHLTRAPLVQAGGRSRRWLLFTFAPPKAAVQDEEPAENRQLDGSRITAAGVHPHAFAAQRESRGTGGYRHSRPNAGPRGPSSRRACPPARCPPATRRSGCRPGNSGSAPGRRRSLRWGPGGCARVRDAPRRSSPQRHAHRRSRTAPGVTRAPPRPRPSMAARSSRPPLPWRRLLTIRRAASYCHGVTVAAGRCPWLAVTEGPVAGTGRRGSLRRVGSAGLLPGLVPGRPVPGCASVLTAGRSSGVPGHGVSKLADGGQRGQRSGVVMRKLLSFHVTSLDGYYEGPGQAFDWPVVDEEFNVFALRQLEEADTLLFGRATYQMMAGYWPTLAARQDDPAVTAKMNGLDKIVISRTLGTAEWAPTRVIGGDVAEVIGKLKQQPGKNMMILGSSALTVSLIGMGLVDEVRVMVTPVVLGDGKSLFRTAADRINLRPLRPRSFRSGNVLLRYQPVAP